MITELKLVTSSLRRLWLSFVDGQNVYFPYPRQSQAHVQVDICSYSPKYFLISSIFLIETKKEKKNIK